ncbi:MAG: hypothetical protein L0387_26850 [Acidobacteria bacterium]|nr:hypothetical protein [Acidobacteriota bacterium]
MHQDSRVASAFRRSCLHWGILVWLYVPLGPLGQFLDLDLDLLFGFTALGCLVWFGSFHVEKEGRMSVLLAALAFTVGCVVGQFIAILLGVGLGLTPRMIQDSMLVHAFYFLTVAASTGVLGGALSSRFLAKALPSEGQR